VGGVPHFPNLEVEMISLQRVTKTYHTGVTALEDVSVEVEKGEFIFVVGPSGSGKSTMIRLLLKQEEATKGEVFVAGKNLAQVSSFKVPQLRRNIGTVFQDYKLLSDKTVFENVAFALEVIGRPKHVIDQRVPEILEYVGLSDKLNSFPDELSGGEQQRVSIARACVNRPLVLLADEPTGNLDPNTSVDIMRLLDKVNRIGTTVLMATHDQAIVDAMRKRVVELEKGRVIRDQARGVYS
jgi:cell division transport system ATP-binding protein